MEVRKLTWLMHLPLRQRKAEVGQDCDPGMSPVGPLGMEELEQFCSSELSQQSFAPSQIQDGWMHAVVFKQFWSSWVVFGAVDKSFNKFTYIPWQKIADAVKWYIIMDFTCYCCRFRDWTINSNSISTLNSSCKFYLWFYYSFVLGNAFHRTHQGNQDPCRIENCIWINIYYNILDGKFN